jgi:hypothetical protein
MSEKKEVELSFADRELMFQDGLQNVMTGLGTSMDKTQYNSWQNTYKNLDHRQLTARFREDWVAQKICTILPQDMTREWRLIDSEEGIKADKKFRIRDLFREAYKWARVYGTSCILLDLKGTGDPSRPLNLKRLRPGCINSLQVVDRTRLLPMGEIIMDPLDPLYGNPTHYQLGGSTQKIHASRVLRFEGTELPKYEHWNNQWYSDSVLIPLFEVIDNFHTAAQSAAALTMEANADVVTVEGLQNLLTHPAGEAAMLKRFRLMKQMKSNHNIILLDQTEDYSTKTIALNGVKDLIWEYLRVIAAAVGVPATRFLSASPDGMNATGESDLSNYIDNVRGLQEAIFCPRLDVIDTVLQAHFGLQPWDYKWNCIFPESALQKATRIKTLSEALKNLFDAQSLSPQTILNILADQHTFGEVNLGSPPPPPKPSQGANTDG